jgi:hypothetical protein
VFWFVAEDFWFCFPTSRRYHLATAYNRSIPGPVTAWEILFYQKKIYLYYRIDL